MQNSSYWPYVSNSSRFFLKADTSAKHKRKREIIHVWKEHKRREHKEQSEILALGQDKAGITHEWMRVQEISKDNLRWHHVKFSIE